MRKRHNPFRYLDIAAEVDSADEEEEEDDDVYDDHLPDDDVAEDPGGDREGTSREFRVPDGDDPDVDAAFRALHQRAISRGINRSSAHIRDDDDEESPSSIPAALLSIGSLPAVTDNAMFCVPCKVGLFLVRFFAF